MGCFLLRGLRGLRHGGFPPHKRMATWGVGASIGEEHHVDQHLISQRRSSTILYP